MLQERGRRRQSRSLLFVGAGLVLLLSVLQGVWHSIGGHIILGCECHGSIPAEPKIQLMKTCIFSSELEIFYRYNKALIAGVTRPALLALYFTLAAHKNLGSLYLSPPTPRYGTNSNACEAKNDSTGR